MNSFLLCSGGYENGTATGKGHLQLDITWNPLGIFEQGQNYIVAGYGLNKKIDIHGYFSAHPEDFNTYYFGIFYQVLNLNLIDIATSLGIRKYSNVNSTHLFFPQILFTIKLINNYEIGGSLVSIRNLNDKYYYGTTADIFFSIPIANNYLKNSNNRLKSVKFSLGAFKPVLWSPKLSDWHPTYSVDINVRLFDQVNSK